MISRHRLTKLDAWVVLADLLALLVREEHVGGQATLRRVGICYKSVCEASIWAARDLLTLLLLTTVGLGLGSCLAGGLLLRHSGGW